MTQKIEELLLQIMEQVLGRPGTKEDAPLFSFVLFENHSGREFISYRDNLLGEIKMFFRDEDSQLKAGWDFIPGEPEFMRNRIFVTA